MPQTNLNIPAIGVSTGGNTGGNTGTTMGSYVFIGSNNITLSQSTAANQVHSIYIEGGAGPGGGITNINLSAGTTSNNLSAFVLADSNGISFGLDGSTITGTVRTDWLSTQSNQALSAGNGSFTFQTASFADSNGVSFSTGTQGIFATVKTDYLTSQSNQAVSAANGSYAFQTLSFSDANGISFGTSAGSAITASHNGLTSQSNQAFSAQGGSSAFQTLVFTNSNGFSFSNTGGSIWGSYTVPTQTNQSAGVYALGNTTGQSSSSTYDARTLSVEGAGIVSVGWSNSSLRISATQSNQAASASNGSFAFQTVAFSNANNVTFGTSAGSIITASVNTGLTSQSNQALSGSNGSFTFQTASFGTLNGLTFYTSNGSMVGSHNALTSQSNQAFSAAGGSSAFQTLNFADTNSVSFTNTNGSVGIASVKLQMYAVSNTTQSSSGTANHTALSFGGAGLASVGVTGGSIVISVPAGAPSPVNFSAGTTSNDLGSVVFSNSNGVSFGLDGSTITASVNAGGGGIANAAGTQTATSGTVVFSNSNGISFGMSGSSVITASAASTYSSTMFWAEAATLTISPGQNAVNLAPFHIDNYITGSILKMPVSLSAQSSGASSGRVGYTLNVGLYQRNETNNTVLTLDYSTSYTYAASYSSNVSMMFSYITGVVNSTSYGTTSTSSAGLNVSSLFTGSREFMIAWKQSMSPGDYWLGYRFSTSTAGTSGNIFVHRPMGAQWILPTIQLGQPGTGDALGIAKDVVCGSYSVTSANLPNVISMSQIRRAGGHMWQAYYLNSTITT